MPVESFIEMNELWDVENMEHGIKVRAPAKTAKFSFFKNDLFMFFLKKK